MKFPKHTIRTHYLSPLGPMTLAAAEEKLVGIWFDGQKHQPDPSAWQQVTEHPVLLACASQLTEYFAGGRKEFELPFYLETGTPFQQKVWQALLQIPCGRTVSYGALSQGLAQASAVRAVAAAVGRNPLTIVVPCHRVVGSNGALTGYAGGLDRKRELLLLEDARPLV